MTTYRLTRRGRIAKRAFWGLVTSASFAGFLALGTLVVLKWWSLI